MLLMYIANMESKIKFWSGKLQPFSVLSPIVKCDDIVVENPPICG